MFSKIAILKTADRVIGGLAVSASGLFLDPEKTSPEKISNILVIRPGGIGDAVLLIPSLKVLKKQFPDTNIDILAEKRNAGILRGNKLVNSLYLYDELSPSGLLAVLKNRYDAVIDTEQWHKLTSVVSFITKAPIRIGFNTNGRGRLYSTAVEYKQSDYESGSFLNLVSELTGKKHRFNTKASFLDVENLIQNKEFREYNKGFNSIVGIFPGATVKERRWGVQKFSELTENLLNNKIGVVILGGTNDIPDADRICRILGRKDYLNLTGKTKLDETTAIISQIDLLVSSDSGLMHIAYGTGTKTVSLFGVGIEEKWAPRGPGNFVINKKLACSPCTKFGYTPGCPINVKCLNEITSGDVLNKTLEALKV